MAAICAWCNHRLNKRHAENLDREALYELFVDMVRQERLGRKRYKLPAHTPDLDHFRLQLHREHFVRMIEVDEFRVSLCEHFGLTLPPGETVVRSRNRHLQERLSELRSATRDASTGGNYYAVTVARSQGNYNIETAQWAIRRIHRSRALIHKAGICSPYGIIYHAEHICRTGHFKRPPVLVVNPRSSFAADGNHKLLAAMLVAGPRRHAQLIEMRRSDVEQNSNHELF